MDIRYTYRGLITKGVDTGVSPQNGPRPKRLAVFASAACLMLSAVGCDSIEFKGQFQVQRYRLPNDQGYRHLTAFINDEKSELTLFGGLDNGPPPTPNNPTLFNDKVYTLNLSAPESRRVWRERSTDTVVSEPWFTSTHGFVEVDDEVYLACDDSNENGVYRFDPDDYTFELLSTPPAPTDSNSDDIRATDCCAVGVKLDSGDDEEEVRIYMIGGRGRTSDPDPVPYVRYYSVTYNRWEQVADLNVGRSHTGCAAVQTHGGLSIYAVAGGDTPGSTSLRSLEVYDVAEDEWTLYPDFIAPAFPTDQDPLLRRQGRTRLSVQAVGDKLLMLIGGDAACAGGGQGVVCNDYPLTNVDLIELGREPRFISGVDSGVPQLNIPRQSPGTALRKKRGKHGADRYELYVVGGKTRTGAENTTSVAPSTEVVSFEVTRGWNRR